MRLYVWEVCGLDLKVWEWFTVGCGPCFEPLGQEHVFHVFYEESKKKSRTGVTFRWSDRHNIQCPSRQQLRLHAKLHFAKPFNNVRVWNISVACHLIQVPWRDKTVHEKKYKYVAWSGLPDDVNDKPHQTNIWSHAEQSLKRGLCPLHQNCERRGAWPQIEEPTP